MVLGTGGEAPIGRLEYGYAAYGGWGLLFQPPWYGAVAGSATG
jgi:hypothetical protein